MQLSRSCQKNSSCAVIKEYRSKVISEIQHHPERLPPNVQLFIPSQHRDPRERSKVIYNNKVTNHQSQIKQP
ncbi:unnamed protein product [Didymodactylos carnosus]|uniref:Uncharacterized protein n=1 Tax=Didymodactylos carnosus TaxID=1234261 RepID=A0A814R5R0_9BILA|nr:unnamed protein product [Didymodactylos carnosus]CAF1128978.1 unnamed protein product [Didymodactylos carnosus]CAF3673802.1 unnamed protein product [Didymodactylos carnosus]CAF3892585.1 unnamed protein product [Didymodactylos carnosus]